jgi:hypothetical protein
VDIVGGDGGAGGIAGKVDEPRRFFSNGGCKRVWKRLRKVVHSVHDGFAREGMTEVLGAFFNERGR